MGRGSSKAGGGGIAGGGGGGTIPPTNMQAMQTPPAGGTQLQADDTQQAPQHSTSYDQFMQMTDDQKAQAITNALRGDVPDHLNKRSDLQKMLYNLGIDEKPQVVDDKTLNSMNGTEVYRTVDAVWDRNTDVSYTAPQIAKQVQAGRYTRVSGVGSSAYGEGLYFATDRGSSTAYGGVRGDVQKTCVMRGKLNNNARSISYSSAYTGAQREMNSGSALGNALKRCNTTSGAMSIWALSKGYNVIDNGMGYINVLNRSALTLSSTVKPK